MTAHELAQRLLNGPDYQVVIGSEATEHFAFVHFKLTQMAATEDEEPLARPVVYIEVMCDAPTVEVFPYTRSQTG